MFLRLFTFLALLACGHGLFGAEPLHDNRDGTVTDPQTRLMWIADENFAINTGWSESVVMNRAEATRLITAMNTGRIENFGYTDWRLPSDWELQHLLEKKGILLTKVKGVSPLLLAREKGADRGPNPAALMPGVGGDDDGDDGERVVTLPVRENTEPDFAFVSIFATNSIQFKQNATVLSGEIVANEASPGPTLANNSELTIGISVETPSAHAVRADTIFIKSNGLVQGDAHYNELDNNGTILGQEFTPLSLPVFSELPPFVEAPVGDDTIKVQDITIDQNDFLALGSGVYGVITVKSGGELRFTGGVYDVEEIDARLGSSLTFDGPSEVRVSGKFQLDQNGYIGAPTTENSTLNASQVVFYIAGINGSNGNLGATPKAAKIGIGTDVFANFYVPNGTLHIRQNANATGAFLAKDVLVGPGAAISLESAFTNRAPNAVDDSATVPMGSSVNVLDSGADSILANDSDADGDLISATTTPVSGPDNGTVTLNADGTFLYTHDGGVSTSDSFVYEVCDNADPQNCSTATVFITVIPDLITVTVNKAGDGDGTVESIPEGIDCGPVCSAVFGVTQFIFLTATPDEGSVFAGWSGDPDCVDGMLLPNGDKNCTANFDLETPPAPGTVDVTVTKDGSGSGTVTSTPAGIDCGPDCVETFPIFTRIELSTFADSGSVFAGWGGDLDCLDGVLDGAEDRNCIATFDEEEPPPASFSLRVIVDGTGSGTVASNPFGILCNTDCSADYAAGTEVTLSGRPDFGSVLVTWGGDCSGTGFSTTVTLDDDKTCTCTFDVPQ